MTDENAYNALAEKTKPSALATYIVRVRLQEKPLSWADTWLLEPSLVPLHLTWIFTLLLGILAFSAWKESRNATEQLIEQVKQAKISTTATLDQVRVLKDEQRAWINAEIVNVSGCFSNDQSPLSAVELGVRLRLTNLGKSPAFEIPDESNIDVIGDKKCHTVKTSIYRKALFPGNFSESTYRFGYKLNNAQRNAAFEGSISAVFKGCIPYAAGVDRQTIHYTYIRLTVDSVLPDGYMAECFDLTKNVNLAIEDVD